MSKLKLLKDFIDDKFSQTQDESPDDQQIQTVKQFIQ